MRDLLARRCPPDPVSYRGLQLVVLVLGPSAVGPGCGEFPVAERCNGDRCKNDGRLRNAATSGFERPPNARFLVRDGTGSEVEALQYYASIIPDFEPGRTRYTLRDWQERYFGADLESCQRSQPAGEERIDARFSAGTDGFSFGADIFRSTNQPRHAQGSRSRFLVVGDNDSRSGSVRFDGYKRWNSGTDNGALEVLLGGVDDGPVQGISGGWTISFDVLRRKEHSLRVRYQLTMRGDFESTEAAQVFVLLDGTPYRDGTKDYIDSLVGSGPGAQSTGPQVFEQELDALAPGRHTLTIGAYLSGTTREDNIAQLLIDEVQLFENAFCRLADGRRVASECCSLVQAFYLNDSDLGFWREMACTQEIERGRGGCMVRNWPNEDAPQSGETDLGTVAMTVSEEGFAQFYVFEPGGGELSPEAVLDGEGPKFVPQICTVCHGGAYKDGSPDLGSVFREFLPSALAAREAAIQQEAEQEWHELNQAVRTANLSLRPEEQGAPQGFDSRVGQIVSHLDEIYLTDFPPVPQGGGSIALVPESWRSASNPQLAQAKRDLWTLVVAPYCIGCHRINNRNFSDYEAFRGLAGEADGKPLLQRFLQDNANAPQGFVMPQAELLFNRLHRDSAALLAVDNWLGLARSAADDTLQTGAADPDKPVVQIEQSLATGQLPGAVDVIIQAVDDQKIASIELTLNGHSLYSKNYALPTSPQRELLSIRDVPVGTHQLAAIATDQAGNTATTTVSLVVEVDSVGERRSLLRGGGLGLNDDESNGEGQYTDAGFACGVTLAWDEQTRPVLWIWLLLSIAALRLRRHQGDRHD